MIVVCMRSVFPLSLLFSCKRDGTNRAATSLRFDLMSEHLWCKARLALSVVLNLPTENFCTVFSPVFPLVPPCFF